MNVPEQPFDSLAGVLTNFSVVRSPEAALLTLTRSADSVVGLQRESKSVFSIPTSGFE